MRKFIGAIDQSTTTTKFLLFDLKGNQILKEIKDHQQITPKQGWLEHNPIEILDNLKLVLQRALIQMDQLKIHPSELATIGITNQRETVVAWNKKTGQPYMNALVWCDTRTSSICKNILNQHDKNINYFKEITGLPINTYFSAFKIKWMIENCDTLRQDIKLKSDEVLFGTMDSWILWNLNGRKHFTDVTNASRTFLMNLKSLQWDNNLLNYFKVPEKSLPEIKPSGNLFGEITEGPFKGCPVNSVLGDQMAAAVGHGLQQSGKSKNTYGTGLFLMTNIGENLKIVQEGILTSVLYQKDHLSKPVYCYEGAIECGGSTINWARDRMNLFKDYDDLNRQIQSVKDSGGVYFVPAFSGLYSPYWNEDAAGLIVGLSFHSQKAHILRAIFDSICYRTKDVIQTMERTANMKIDVLNVDGGITTNDPLMNLQANILQKKLIRPKITDATCLGTALFAALNKGLFKNENELLSIIENEKEYDFDRTLEHSVAENYKTWLKAIERSKDWYV